MDVGLRPSVLCCSVTNYTSKSKLENLRLYTTQNVVGWENAEKAKNKVNKGKNWLAFQFRNRVGPGSNPALETG